MRVGLEEFKIVFHLFTLWLLSLASFLQFAALAPVVDDEDSSSE
jgi:hypothetical protein